MTIKSPENGKILIVGGYTFSRGEAGSNYVIGLGKALEETGYEVEYLADDPSPEPMREEYRSFKCYCAPPESRQRGWRSALANLSAADNSLLNWLNKVPTGEVATIIAHVGGLPVAFLYRLQRLCVARGWKLAMIVGEWQGFAQFARLKLRQRLLAVLDSELQRRMVNKRVKHIIAISRYLQRYYQNSGCHTILIPPLIDCRAKKWGCRISPTNPRRELKLLFSGGWWRDRLDLITEAMLQLRNEGLAVTLEFLGSGADDLSQSSILRSQLARGRDGTFHFHGNVPVERVLPITASADFGVFLRDKVKWAEACFPSKVAEFQGLGVPVLCNITSNLEDVLTDGENALFVPEVSAGAFAQTVKRALRLPWPELCRMKQRSLDRAATWFDYRTYCGPLKRYFDEMPESL